MNQIALVMAALASFACSVYLWHSVIFGNDRKKGAHGDMGHVVVGKKHVRF